jgi:hypothetical protein
MRPLIIVLLTAWAVSLSQHSAEYVLDLLTYRHGDQRPSAAPSDVVPGEVRGEREGDSTRAEHLVVSLLDLDRSAYAPGETVVGEITITNAGSTAVAIPWCPDRTAIPAKDLVQGILAFEVRDATGKHLLGRLQPQGLYGSAAVAGTLQTLAPGDRARIRLPSRWNSSDAERDEILRQPSGLVKVFAVYQHDLQEDRSAAGSSVAFLSRSGG